MKTNAKHPALVDLARTLALSTRGAAALADLRTTLRMTEEK